MAIDESGDVEYLQ